MQVHLGGQLHDNFPLRSCAVRPLPLSGRAVRPSTYTGGFVIFCDLSALGPFFV